MSLKIYLKSGCCLCKLVCWFSHLRAFTMYDVQCEMCVLCIQNNDIHIQSAHTIFPLKTIQSVLFPQFCYSLHLMRTPNEQTNQPTYEPTNKDNDNSKKIWEKNECFTLQSLFFLCYQAKRSKKKTKKKKLCMHIFIAFSLDIHFVSFTMYICTVHVVFRSERNTRSVVVLCSWNIFIEVCIHRA